MKILKKNKKKKIFFFEIGIFFFKLGKKSPKSHWERGRISAPDKKIPADRSVSDNQSSSVTLNELAIKARKTCSLFCHFMELKVNCFLNL